MRWQIRDHAEVALVADHQSVAEVKRGSTDEQVREGIHPSALAGLGIDLRDDMTNFTRKPKNGNWRTC